MSLYWVNGAQTAGELDALRKSVNSGTAYGLEDWMMGIGNMLQLEFTVHRPGRYTEKSVSRQKKFAAAFSLSAVF
jgi:hypothetical protein